MSKSKGSKPAKKPAKKRALKHVEEHDLLAKLLREIRETADISQLKLAKKLGVAQTWVHFLETGNYRISMVDFVRWCLACGTKPEKETERFTQSLP